MLNVVEVIDAKQAAEICGVSWHLFRQSRRGIFAPKPLPKARASEPDMFDAAEMRAWAATNNFWELASDYRYRLRYGDKPRKNKRAHKVYKAPNPPKGEVSKEILKRHDAVKLRPALQQFLRGDFAPAHKKAAYEMKALRARLNKPETVRVQLQGDGGY